MDTDKEDSSRFLEPQPLTCTRGEAAEARPLRQPKPPRARRHPLKAAATVSAQRLAQVKRAHARRQLPRHAGHARASVAPRAMYPHAADRKAVNGTESVVAQGSRRDEPRRRVVERDPVATEPLAITANARRNRQRDGRARRTHDEKDARHALDTRSETLRSSARSSANRSKWEQVRAQVHEMSPTE